MLFLSRMMMDMPLQAAASKAKKAHDLLVNESPASYKL